MPASRIARIVAVVWFAALLHARPAAASCVVDDQGTCYRFWHSETVFLGEVREKTVVGKGIVGDSYRLRVSVLESFRGARKPGSSITLYIRDGECGVGAEMGAEVFFYADRGKDGELWASMYSKHAENAVNDLAYARSVSATSPSAMVYGEVLQRDDPVVDSDSFKPMRGVLIRVRGTDFEAEALTDEKGRYSIHLPGAGKYSVEAIAPEGFAESLGLEPSNRFEFDDPRECLRAEFQLIRNGRIRGVVLDANRQPIPNLVIDAGEVLRQAKTGESGEFDIGPLSPGDYRLTAVTGGDAVTLRPGSVKVLLGQTTTVSEVMAIVTRALTTLTIDLSGLPDNEGWVEIRSTAGEELGRPARIETQSPLTFLVEGGASFEVFIATPAGLKKATFKAESRPGTVKLAQLAWIPQQ